jgi:DNA mismatch repair protein, C-terminal domain
VGTTLRIQGFLQALPVRKEVAKKDGSKTLANIKKLLYTYAYARTSVRFALKVLRANSERANWSYSPNLGSISLQDTVTKIVGQDVAAQCELRSANLQQTISQSAGRVLYSVEAVIVRTDAGLFSVLHLFPLSDCHAEASKVQNVGTYVSIDGRPVNPARGVIKNIVKLYKSFYRAASGNADRKPSNVDPFLCMHIRCPPESYDVNIEPAKDDVLFSEPLKVIALVEKLFRDYYGELASDTPTRSRSSAKYQAKTAPDERFGLLLARKAAGTAEASAAVQLTLPAQFPADSPGRTRVPNVEPLRNGTDICHAPVLIPEPPSFYQSDRSPHQPTHAVWRNSVEGSEPRFNMYGMDDDDLFEMISPPSTHHPLSEEADENEVRSARVTNPWSLAKLNAPARQSVGERSAQADSGLTVQLMTPGRGQNNQSRNLQRLAYPQQSMHPNSSLPSPVASLPTPAPYQNPGPPIRRRAFNEQQDQDDNAIARTQDFVTEASHPRPSNTLDTWVQPHQPAVQLLSFKKASVSCNGDDGFGTVRRPDFERQERSLDNSLLTRLTEPDDFLAEPSRTSNHISKPFKSPFKGRSVISSRHIANLESLDSSCIGLLPAPPPPKVRVPLPDQEPSSQRPLSATDYENQSTSMPPPPSPSQRSFKMSQSPNTELADILEFEQRKKAAVLHQRKSQSNRALSEPNPTKLAHVQRKTDDTSLVQVISSQTRQNLPSLDLREKQSNPARPFERDTKSFDEAAGSLLNRNTPHRNRYLAAKERLGYVRPESDHKQCAGHSDQEKCNAGELLDETEVRLSEDDPRAYLVRNSGSGQKTDSLSGLTRTGLKIRRTKTARLPLETIPAGAANNYLKAITPEPFPSTSPLAVMSRRQSQCDEYVRSGKNSFVRWSANSRDVTVWEKTLKELISKSYKARLAEGEIVAPELTVMLTTAIKAHADAYGP